MITPRDKQKVLSTLQSVVGTSEQAKDDNFKFYCPFCNHRKKKLEVNLSSQKWNCWVCNTRGKSIYSLLKRLNADKSKYSVLNEVYDDTNTFLQYKAEESEEERLTLPEEFRPLHIKPSSMIHIGYSNARHYLKKRGIGMDLIKKYNIGYCERGRYGGCVIIPSYDENHQLNYFVARSYNEESGFTYLNPPVGRNVIMFADQINWNEPITLCEGAFDAIALRRNAIPTLGVVIPTKLMNAIFMNGVKQINMFYDRDAQERSLYYTNYFISNNINVKHILPEKGKDPDELGFQNATKLINESTASTWSDVVRNKLKII